MFYYCFFSVFVIFLSACACTCLSPRLALPGAAALWSEHVDAGPTQGHTLDHARVGLWSRHGVGVAQATLKVVHASGMGKYELEVATLDPGQPGMRVCDVCALMVASWRVCVACA